MLAEAALLVALSVQQGSGAEACMGAEQLRRGVETRLQRRVFVKPAQASLRLVVIFSRRNAQTEARIELSSIDGAPRGTRSLVTSGHCSALDDALALSVALLVDQPPEPEPEPSSSALTPSLTPPPATSSSASRAAPPTSITIPPEVAAPREPWEVRFGVSGVGAWGVLPGVRAGGALYFKLVPGNLLPVVLQLEGFGRATAERNASSGARFRLLRAGLALCPALHERPEMALGLCVGQKVGWLTVEGYGFDRDQQDRRLVFALTAGGEGRLRLVAPISLRGYLGAEVPLIRDRFASSGRNATELFRPHPVGILGEIGLEAALW